MMGTRGRRRQVVQLRAILPADVNHIFETGRGDQRRSRLLCAPAKRWWRLSIRGSLRAARAGGLREPARITLAGERGFDRSLKVSD